MSEPLTELMSGSASPVLSPTRLPPHPPAPAASTAASSIATA